MRTFGLVRVIRVLSKIHDALRGGFIVLVALAHQDIVVVPGGLSVHRSRQHLQVVLLHTVNLKYRVFFIHRLAIRVHT